MTTVPEGLSIAEVDDGFILYRESSDSVVSFALSQAEAFGLKAKLDLWQLQQISHAQAKSGSVRAVVSHEIAEADIAKDALQTEILLSLKAPTGEVMTFRLPKDASRFVAEEIMAILPTLQDVPKDFQ